MKEVLEEILRLVDVKGTVRGEMDTEGVVHLNVSTEIPALLIGHHGRTLAALQTVLSVIAYKKYGERVRLVVDVDGWRERRNEVVTGLAQQAAQSAKETGTPQPIYNLTPYERRLVHLALSEDRQVITESQGEGRERFIIVKPKGNK
ncbi:MAG: R3H domain-containing nucleic acid-binding protein [Patescibacteria group bacterium]